MKSFVKKALVGVGAVGGVASNALASGVTIPDTGINVGSYITAGITSLGAVAAIAVGGYFAFLVVKRALKWGNKIG